MTAMKCKYYLMGLLSLFLCGSCENFLTEQPVHNLTLENAVQDYEGAKNVINGMYATLSLGSGTSASDFLGGTLFNALSTQAGILRAGGTTWYNMTYNSTTSSLNTFWQNWYACVNAANAAIISISALTDDQFPDPQEKQRMIAEAKCFRAWIHAHLLWYFSHFWEDDEYGILYREEVADMANMITPRLSVRESYEKIFADLQEAIDNLEDYTKATRLSRQLAQVLKVKLLLNRGWEGDYDEASTLLNEIITTAPAGFAMEPDMAKMYEDAWDSHEVLWARYLEDDGSRAYGEFGYSQQLIVAGDEYIDEETQPSSLKSFYPEFNNWITADPRYDVTMGWARYLSATGTLYFCPTKLARGGRADMNDKFTTYYFRYPELLIMQAELLARTGAPLSEAIAPINLMRSQRTNPQLSPLPVPSSEEELMDAIFREYCLELYGENGSDWLASLRMEKNGEPWFKTLKADIDVARITLELCSWPIPSTETSVNTAIKPNPGYDN